MMWIWSVVLAAVGILGIYLAGRKNLWGWAVGFGAQILWIVFAVATQQWGFIASAIAYGWVYGLNWWKWRKAERARPVGTWAFAEKSRTGRWPGKERS